MGRRIELPQLPKGQPQEQLKALYSYLYQMAEALNNNLAEIGNGDFTDEEMTVVREIVGTDNTADSGRAEAETLKSLIIKTAQLIKSEIDQYNMKLVGTYEADGKLGRYVRKTRLDVDVTPGGIQQNYTFQEIIQGLKTYEVNAKNYIKTGYLRTESSIPVYGVAIGKDVVTFSEDGTETYNDGNKVAELTADELSFWQNQNKVASYTGNKISFYYGNTEAFYIQNGKIYAAGDMEITAGNKLKVSSGGTFEVDTSNFVIDSTNEYMRIGDSTLNEHGMEQQIATNKKVIFGAYPSVTSSVMAGVLAGINDDNYGKISLYTSPSNTYYASSLCVESEKTTDGSNDYLARVSLKESSGVWRRILGDEGAGQFELAHIAAIVGGRLTSNGANGTIFKLMLDYDCDYKKTTSLYNHDRLEIQYVSSILDALIIHAYRADGTQMPFVLYSDLEVRSDIKSLYTIEGYNVKYTNLIQNSSKDIKHNIRDMDSPGERLDRLRPVTFVYDDDPAEKTRAGLIYEETEPVMPEICTGDEGNKAISYMELVPMLLKEIQDLRARVKALEER